MTIETWLMGNFDQAKIKPSEHMSLIFRATSPQNAMAAFKAEKTFLIVANGK